jgi:hypothetical protein
VRPEHATDGELADVLTQSAQRAGEQAPSVRGADWRTAVVTAVGTGTITADGLAWRCLETYARPAIGDVAVVSQSSNGNLIAWGRTSSGATWTPVSLSGAWTANASYYTPAYRLWGDGTASLCGLASMSGTLASGTTVATLPAAATPAAQVRVTAQVAIGFFGVITITTAGAIQLSDFNPALPGTGTKYLQLDALGRYRLA